MAGVATGPRNDIARCGHDPLPLNGGDAMFEAAMRLRKARTFTVVGRSDTGSGNRAAPFCGAPVFQLRFVIALSIFGWWGVAVSIIYPLQMLRRTFRLPGSWCSRVQFSFFELLSRFPEALGQFKFARDRLLGRQGRLIEYK